MPDSNDGATSFSYLDFELEIKYGSTRREYPVVVVHSPRGKAQEIMHFPFDELTLENRLLALQNALLRSHNIYRGILTPEQQTVQDFGRALFDALISGEVRSHYDLSRKEANQQNKGLRLKLRIEPPELAALPWEFLYDSRQLQYVGLSHKTPIVRYLDVADSIEPLAVKPPLRILGIVASPADLPILDIKREKQQVEKALAELQVQGLVELVWATGQTSRDLHKEMRSGPWHIFHFIGHGGFDSSSEEGFIVLSDEDGQSRRVGVEQLTTVLTDRNSPQLVVLNSCDGAQSSQRDVFSSTAATLVQRGVPAVLAMQHCISDEAAREFSQAFYDALASMMPVDAAVVQARQAVQVALKNTVEWGTPVLYMRSPDGVLFNLPKTPKTTRRPLRVFLCHSSDDKPMVRELYQRLKAEKGIDPWLDEEKLIAGQNWDMEIQKALRATDVVVVCLSRNAAGRQGYVHKEIKKALDIAEEKPEDSIFMIPLRLEECGMPERLKQWHYVNFFEERGYEKLKEALEILSNTLDADSRPLGDMSQPPKPEVVLPKDPSKAEAKKTEAGAQNSDDVKIAISNDTLLKPMPLRYHKASGVGLQTAAPSLLDDLLIRFGQAETEAEWDKVIELGQQILELKADYQPIVAKIPLAYYRRGVSHHTKRNYDQAILDYNQAIYLSPREPGYYSARGRVYFNKGDFDRAIADYNKALELNPVRADYYKARGYSFYYKKDFDRAIADLKYSLNLEPNQESHSQVWEVLEKATKERDKLREQAQKQAEEEIRAVMAQVERRITELTSQLTLAENAADWDNAIRTAESILTLDITRQNIRLRLANAHWARGVELLGKNSYKAARADFERAIFYNPDNAGYYRDRGLSYHNIGDYDRAIEDKTKALELNPTKASYHLSRGTSYYCQGDYERALTDHNRAIELDPERADFFYERGRVYRALNNQKKMQSDFQQAANLGHEEAKSELKRLPRFKTNKLK